MKVAVFGGSGLVGSLIVPRLAVDFDVVIVDPKQPGFSTEARWLSVDVHDEAALSDVLINCGAVVYAAMGPKDDWEQSIEWAEAQFDINVKLLWAVADAAARHQVRRFVHLSTMSVFQDYLLTGKEEGWLPDATDVYGMTKRFGELVCRAAAVRSTMSAISLRLVGPMPDAEWRDFDDPHLADVVTAGTDVAAAVRAAILKDMDPGTWDSFPISGDAQYKFVDLRRSREELGWSPTKRGSDDDEIGAR